MEQYGEGVLLNTDLLARFSFEISIVLLDGDTTLKSESTTESTLAQTSASADSDAQSESLIFDLLDINLPKEPDTDPLARPNKTLLQLLDGSTTPNSEFTLYQTANFTDFYIWGENSVFDPTQATYVLTHGWQDYPVNDTKWVDLASSIFEYDPL